MSRYSSGASSADGRDNNRITVRYNERRAKHASVQFQLMTVGTDPDAIKVFEGTRKLIQEKHSNWLLTDTQFIFSIAAEHIEALQNILVGKYRRANILSKNKGSATAQSDEPAISKLIADLKICLQRYKQTLTQLNDTETAIKRTNEKNIKTALDRVAPFTLEYTAEPDSSPYWYRFTLPKDADSEQKEAFEKVIRLLKATQSAEKGNSMVATETLEFKRHNARNFEINLTTATMRKLRNLEYRIIAPLLNSYRRHRNALAVDPNSRMLNLKMVMDYTYEAELIRPDPENPIDFEGIVRAFLDVGDSFEDEIPYAEVEARKLRINESAIAEMNGLPYSAVSEILNVLAYTSIVENPDYRLPEKPSAGPMTRLLTACCPCLFRVPRQQTKLPDESTALLGGHQRKTYQ